MPVCQIKIIKSRECSCLRLQLFAHLWLHVHHAALVLSQNPANGLQAGAVQVVVILPKLYKPAPMTQSAGCGRTKGAKAWFASTGVCCLLSALDVGLEGSLNDEVVLDSVPLVGLPGSSGVCWHTAMAQLGSSVSLSHDITVNFQQESLFSKTLIFLESEEAYQPISKIGDAAKGTEAKSRELDLRGTARP